MMMACVPPEDPKKKTHKTTIAMQIDGSGYSILIFKATFKSFSM
jgi:hypothetical protein